MDKPVSDNKLSRFTGFPRKPEGEAAVIGADALREGAIKLSAGRKQHLLVRVG